MTTTLITTDVECIVTRCLDLDYADAVPVRAACEAILSRGMDVILFENHDLGSFGSRPLMSLQSWDRARETPPHAPDTDSIGLGWRYLPAIRLTVEVK